MYNTDLHGKVTVEVHVAPNGGVTSASVASTTANDPRLESCLVASLKGWTFPEPVGGVPGAFKYTFNFE